MVYNLMLKFVQPFIRFQGIGIQCRSSLNVLADFRLKGLLLAAVYNFGPDFAAALKDSEHHSLVFTASPGNLAGLYVFVNVASFTAHESFVGFNVARCFLARPHVEHESNAVIHEPCGFLSDADGAMNFVGGDPVFAVHNLPHGGHPLIQNNGRILHDGPSFQSELRGRMLCATVPAVVLLKEQHIGTSTLRAGNSIGPASRHEIFTAVYGIGEVYDCFLECGRFHESSMPESGYFVK